MTTEDKTIDERFMEYFNIREVRDPQTGVILYWESKQLHVKFLLEFIKQELSSLEQRKDQELSQYKQQLVARFRNQLEFETHTEAKVGLSKAIMIVKGYPWSTHKDKENT